MTFFHRGRAVNVGSTSSPLDAMEPQSSPISSDVRVARYFNLEGHGEILYGLAGNRGPTQERLD